MAYTNIDKGSDYFNTKLYTGNGSTQSINGIGFQPDWIWFKVRSETGSHRIVDSVRGNTKYLYANGTDAEATVTTNVTSFDSDGFSLGNGSVNENTRTYASWSWLASNTTASNTDGSITSTVSANTTSGFSIVSYTGNGTSGATVGHGLDSAPACYVVKSRDTAYDWRMYHQGIGATKYLNLNQTIAAGTATNAWNNTAPTSSVFSLGNGATVNQSSDDFIAYCFAEKKGFSKFGSYVGNGNSNGPFIYTGFKPAWVVMKGTNVNGWLVIDNKRTAFNSDSKFLYPSEPDAEESLPGRFDFLSNGFKLRNTWTAFNSSGQEYIYMAFAENPFVTSTGIPACAR